jgi:hypothetical protein
MTLCTCKFAVSQLDLEDRHVIGNNIGNNIVAELQTEAAMWLILKDREARMQARTGNSYAIQSECQTTRMRLRIKINSNSSQATTIVQAKYLAKE